MQIQASQVQKNLVELFNTYQHIQPEAITAERGVVRAVYNCRTLTSQLTCVIHADVKPGRFRVRLIRTFGFHTGIRANLSQLVFLTKLVTLRHHIVQSMVPHEVIADVPTPKVVTVFSRCLQSVQAFFGL